MDIPVKTLQSGFSLPVFGLGTYMLGGAPSDGPEIEAIQAALERGITHLDTAEVYADGHCEEIIGQAIQSYDRSQLQITTKVSGGHQAYDDVLRACESSLHRLNTDYIDLYLLHRFPIVGIDIHDTMRALDRLVEQGMVKNIGVSNFTVNRFEAAQKVSANKLVCNQVEYSLQVREVERRGIIEYCQQNDVLITSWGPLQKGLLGQTTIVDDIAKKYHKTPYQVALNWVMSQPNVVTIPKARSIAHLDENLGALGWNLSDDDIELLRRDYPDQLTTSERVPLDYDADVAA